MYPSLFIHNGLIIMHQRGNAGIQFSPQDHQMREEVGEEDWREEEMG